MAGVVHSCGSCGHSSPRWFGRCPQCGEWGTSACGEAAAAAAPPLVVVPLDSAGGDVGRLPTGMGEVDRVLGGGFVRGEALLLAGEPGVGKSTLVLQLLGSLVRGGSTVLMVTGEESLGQVALRAGRLGEGLGNMPVAFSTSVDAVASTTLAQKPDVLVVDSVQTLADARFDQPAGSQVQVRECAARLVQLAKETGTVLVMIGHVTKEGAVAGPKTLEHVVDAVVTLEGERSESLRLLRAAKNRFGSCEEIGIFEMSPAGLVSVPDPSTVFLADRSRGVCGSVVFPTLEGARPLMVEIQSLVSGSDLAHPRRVAIGVEARRLALLIGIIEEHGSLSLKDQDVFVAGAAGLAVREPAADLAICLAVCSAAYRVAIPEDVVALGEVGLGGGIRKTPGTTRRLEEATRLGFRRAIVPEGTDRGSSTLPVIEVADIQAAFSFVRSAATERGSVGSLHPSHRAVRATLGAQA